MRNDTLYKKFRGVNDIVKPSKGVLSKRFDEPTYFSFRLIFATDSDKNYNNSSNSALYDVMPHPLFNVAESNYSAPTGGNTNVNNTAGMVKDKLSYSAVRYLEDANEPTRAQMLREFISKFEELQYNFPYYFQAIDGISELLKIDPTKGQRILNDKKISITCLEGLDLRMSYLLNLYKQIVWDNTYQRWVLPDMMRYFTLKVYLSEFRTFHMPAFSENDAISGYSNNLKNSNESTPLFLAILDDILPTWEITCEMCEFDLTDITFEHLNSLSVNGEPNQGAVKFAIKIGNIKELQTYPVFTHTFLSDRKINAINRAREEISTLNEANNAYLYPASLQISQTRDAGSSSNRHVSGMPFNERANENNLDEANIEQEKIGGSTLDVNFNPAQPETWVGNAISFGAAYANNFVNKLVDKATTVKIPGLGVSLGEIKTVLDSKNIIGALGLIRKGVNEVVEHFNSAPSSRLEQPIQTDIVMRQFLTALTKSEATDNDTITLKDSAFKALNDAGTWEKIKDYSMATNMVGRNEINVSKTLQGTEQYEAAVAQQRGVSSTSKDIDNNSGMPSVLPNAASNRVLSTESDMSQDIASSKLTSKIQSDLIERGAASGNLNSDIKNNSTTTEVASSKLSSNIQSDNKSDVTPSGNLTKNIQASSTSITEASKELSGTISETIKQTKASSGLSSGISESAINTNVKKVNTIDSNAAINQGNAGIKTKTIEATQIIEAQPSQILINKINAETIKQPNLSKATTNKIEEQKIENALDSKATNSKVEKIDALNNSGESQATNQELFSK